MAEKQQYPTYKVVGVSGPFRGTVRFKILSSDLGIYTVSMTRGGTLAYYKGESDTVDPLIRKILRVYVMDYLFHLALGIEVPELCFRAIS